MPRQKKKWTQPTAVVPPSLPAPRINPEYLDIRQAAIYMSVTVWTIRRLLKAGKIHAKKVGKRFTIKRTDLDVYWQQAEAA